MWLRGEDDFSAEAAAQLFGEFVLRGLAWLRANQRKER